MSDAKSAMNAWPTRDCAVGLYSMNVELWTSSPLTFLTFYDRTAECNYQNGGHMCMVDRTII